ncbi:MAG: rRNA maturation RNase YbeY [Clostridia bacterium]|nr:rRNA maturation RNase YbeY [Clostridia bacterium]
MNHRIIIVNEQDKEPFLKETQNLLTHVIRESLFMMGAIFSAEVSVTLTDNEKIQKINKEHRDIDSATDVLSFPQYTSSELDEFELDEKIVLGDIVISCERAREQSVEYDHSYTRELAFLAVHSVLHLLGYDHMTPDEEKVMCELQNYILDSIGIVRSGHPGRQNARFL